MRTNLTLHGRGKKAILFLDPGEELGIIAACVSHAQNKELYLN